MFVILKLYLMIIFYIDYSKFISFLFQSIKDDNSKPNFKKSFGFRYYQNNKNDTNNYFTLIKKEKDSNLNDFFISEKTNNKEDEIFKNDSLDCFTILKKLY